MVVKITQAILSVSMLILRMVFVLDDLLLSKYFPSLNNEVASWRNKKVCTHDDKHLCCTNLR